MEENINIAEDITTKDSDIDKLEGLQAEENKQAIDDGQAETESVVKPVDKLSFADKIVRAYARPAETSALENKDEFWDLYKDEYIKKHKGDETAAKDELSKIYEATSKEYQNLAQKESDTEVLESLKFMTFGIGDYDYIGEDYLPDIEAAEFTDAGRMKVLDMWTDKNRSLRDAAIDAKEVVLEDGTVVDIKNNMFDELLGKSDYTNKDGKQIIGFEYELADEYRRGGSRVKAIYEGQEATTELVSRYDATDGWLSNNGLDTSTWKVATGSVLDFAVDLADLAVSAAETVIALGGPSDIKDTEVYEALRATRMGLASRKTSRSDHDQENMFTFNNMLSMGMQVGLQLASGRGVAWGMSKMLGVGTRAATKIATMQKELAVLKSGAKGVKSAAKIEKIAAEAISLEKKILRASKVFNRNANIVKKSTLAFMGMMQAKGTADLALRNGFSPRASALIYLASLGGMMVVNQLSDLGFESLGLNTTNKIIQRSVKNTMTGITGKTPNAIGKVLGKSKEAAVLIRDNVQAAMKSSSILSGAMIEGLEEESELIMDELVKHTASAISLVGWGAESPTFKTAFDEGYWEDFATESLMSVIGGAFGGAGMSGVSKVFGKDANVNEDELPIKGDPADVIKRIAYYSTRTQKGIQNEAEFLAYTKKLKSKGQLGRNDISTKWDSDNGRYKRMNELSKKDAQEYSSQSEMLYKATIGQYMYYKEILSKDTREFDAIVEESPEFSMVKNGKPLFESTTKLLTKKSQLYTRSNVGDAIDFDLKIKELNNLHSKIKYDKDGNLVDDKLYQTKLDDLSKTIKLSKKEIKELMDVELELEAISSGAILEKGFIELQLKDEKYKGKLSYDDFENLVSADVDANVKFKETQERAIESQVQNDAEFELEMQKSEVLTDDAVQKILNTKVLPLSVDTKRALVERIDKMGVSLDSQKATAMNLLLKDLIPIVRSNPEIFQFINKQGEVENANVVEAIAQQIVTDPSGISKLIDTFNKTFESTEDTNILDNVLQATGKENFYVVGEEFTTSYGEAAYILQKLESIGLATSDEAFSHVKYNLGSVLDSDDVTETLADAGIFTRTESYESNPEDKKISELIPADSLSKEKDRLKAQVNNAQTFIKGSPREDLLFGFTKNAAGSIKPDEIGLEQKYDVITENYKKDDEDKVTSFSNLEIAKSINDQVDTRILETQFILQFLPTLAKLRDLNVNDFKNEDTPLTFLTSYINDYIVPFDKFEDDPEFVLNRLQSISKRLVNLKSKTQVLLDKAAESSSDLEQAYIGDAKIYAENQLVSFTKLFTRNEGDTILDEHQELREIFDRVNTLDFKDPSESNLGIIFKTLYDVKKLLNNTYTKDPEFINKVIALKDAGSNLEKRVKTVALMTLSPADTIYGILKTSISGAFDIAKTDPKKLTALKLPTINQIAWIEEVVTAAISEDYLPSVSGTFGNAAESYKNIAVFDGLQGTGKTQVVAGMAADIIQEFHNRRSVGTGKKPLGILLASNEKEQVEVLRNSVDESVVTVADLNGNKSVTQVDLWELLVNIDDSKIGDAKAALDGVGTIIYDEISYMEFSIDEGSIDKVKTDIKNAPVLNSILYRLEKINELRRAEKQTPIVIIGLGDHKQGGFVEGMASPRTPNVDEDSLSGSTSNIFINNENELTYVSDTTLTHNFRATVTELKSGAEEFRTNLHKLSTPTIEEVTFIHNVDGEEYTGIQKSNDWRDDVINNEKLKTALETKLSDKDSDFKLLIISGKKKYDGSVKDSLLQELIDKYPDKVITRGFYNVQGAEADYVLINVPDNFLLVNEEQVNTDKTGDLHDLYMDRVNRISMAIGRSYRYTNIVFKEDFPSVKGKSGETHVDSIKEGNAFKERWGNVLLKHILNDYKDTGSSKLRTEVKTEITINNIDDKATLKDVIDEYGIEVGGTVEVGGELFTVEDVVYDNNGDRVTLKNNENSLELTLDDFKEGKVKTVKVDDVNVDTSKNDDTQIVTDEISIGIDTKEAQLGPLVPDIVRDSETDVINEEGMVSLIKEVARKFGVEDTENLSEDLINIKIAKLQEELSNADNAGKTLMQKSELNNAILALKNIKNILYNNTSDEVLEGTIKEDVDTADDLSETSNSDKDFMKEVEKATGKTVLYSHVNKDSLRRGGRFSSYSTKKNYLANIYGVETDNNGNPSYTDVSEAEYLEVIGLGKDKVDPKSAMSLYDYKLVSFEFFADNRIQYNNIVVATNKKSGKKIFVAQFAKSDDYDITSPLHILLKEREDILTNEVSDVVEIKQGNKTIIDDNQSRPIRYIESDIINPSTILGATTVGNLVEGGNAIKTESLNVDYISDNTKDVAGMNPGKFVRTKVSDRSNINAIQRLKVEGKFTEDPFLESTLSTFPFTELTPDKFIGYINSRPYVLVKTSHGITPFIETSTGTFIPLIGVYKKGKSVVELEGNAVITGKKDNKYYDEELSQISKSLRGLNLKGKSELFNKYVIDEDTSENNAIAINSALNINLDELNIDESTPEEYIRNRFTMKFAQNTERFFGNIKIPLNIAASKLWGKTGGPKTLSAPFIFTKGPNAGKGVVFYTFRQDIDLTAMSEEAMLNLYKNSIISKNKAGVNPNVALTDNNLGIGQILLDVEGKSLTEIYNDISDGDLKARSAADVNKAIVSGSTENKLISLFAQLYDRLSEDKNSVGVQLTTLDTTVQNVDILTWVEQQLKKDSKGLDALREVLETIFSRGSLGSMITTTTEGYLKTMVEMVNEAVNIGGTNSEVNTRLKAVWDSFQTSDKKALSSSKFAKKGTPWYEQFRGITQKNRFMSILEGLKIDSPEKLLSLEVKDANANGAAGNLLLNNKGKVVILPSLTTVISAVDKDLVTNIANDASAYQEPKFNMLKLMQLLHNDSTSKDRELILSQLDTLLPLVEGFEHGIFVSPVITDTSKPIVRVDKDVVRNESIFFTTVKQIKEPSVVIRNNIGSRLEHIVAPTVEEVDVTFKDTIERDIVNIQTTGDVNAVFENIKSNVELKDGITQAEANILYEHVADRFNEITTIPTKEFHKIKISSIIAPVPGTETLIKDLEDFANIAPTLELLQIFKDVKGLNNAQYGRLIQFVNSINESNFNKLDESTLHNNIKRLYNKESNPLSMLKEDTMNTTESALTFSSGIRIIKEHGYLKSLDVSPEDKVELLLNNVKVGEEKAILDIVMNLNPNITTNISKLKSWSYKAISYNRTLSNMTQEQIEELSLSILSKENLHEYTAEEVSVLFSNSIGNPLNFFENNQAFMSFIENSYYNSDNAIHTYKLLYQGLVEVNTAGNEQLSKIKVDLLQTIRNNTQERVNKLQGSVEKITNIKKDIDTIMKVDMDVEKVMIKNVGEMKTALSSSTYANDLDADTKVELETLLTELGDAGVVELAAYIKNPAGNDQILTTTMEILIRNGVDDKVAMNISDFIGNLATDEDYNCYTI